MPLPVAKPPTVVVGVVPMETPPEVAPLDDAALLLDDVWANAGAAMSTTRTAAIAVFIGRFLRLDEIRRREHDRRCRPASTKRRHPRLHQAVL